MIEHIGLGRYGDPLCTGADLQAIGELRRVLTPGGSLLLVVPVGCSRICFNPHRVYSYSRVLEGFPELELQEFSVIHNWPSERIWTHYADPDTIADRDYNCGCFWFKRPDMPAFHE